MRWPALATETKSSREAEVARTTRPVMEGWFRTDPPALIGGWCPECSTVVFPPSPGPCPNPRCEGTELEPRPLSRRGRIWSYTDARYQPPPPYIPRTEPYEPFAIAAVELDDGIVVLGQLAEGVGTADVAVGDEVEVEIAPLYRKEGEDVVTWTWRPVRRGGGA